SREQAEAMLRGEGGELEPGLYAFIDGNHLGGVGVVIVRRDADAEPETIEAIGLTVVEVFAGGEMRSLSTRAAGLAGPGGLRQRLGEPAARDPALGPRS